MIPHHLLITLGLIGVVFLVTLFGFTSHNVLILYGMVAVPPLIFLVNRPDLLFLSAIALFASYVTLPGMPWNMNAFILLGEPYSAHFLLT